MFDAEMCKDGRRVQDRRQLPRVQGLKQTQRNVLLLTLYTATHARSLPMWRRRCCVVQVRASRDRRRCVVLWDCFPEQVAACERRLAGCASLVQALVGERLKARHTPFLEFKHDRLTQGQVGTVDGRSTRASGA